MELKKRYRWAMFALLSVVACSGNDDGDGGGNGDGDGDGTLAICGDGILHPDEACDTGSTSEDSTCIELCTINTLCQNGVYEGDLTVSDDDSLRRVSGCTSIDGDVEIVASSVTTLQPLSALESISGELSVSDNTSLQDLAGLSSLTSVGEGLRIRNNSLITDLTGLEQLTTVRGQLSLAGDALTSIEALSNLSSLGGLSASGGFADLSGLEGVTTIAGNVTILGGEQLKSLNGLDNLNVIEGDLSLSGGLNDISALSNLTTIGGEYAMERTGISSLAALSQVSSVQAVDLDDNYGLVEIGGGFDAVTEIPGDIVTTSNGNLLHLDGFNSLETLGGALWLSEFSVTDVTGFSNLRQVCATGPHFIFDCLLVGSDPIVDLSGFDNLETIGGRARIDGDVLQDIFPSLLTVAEDLILGGLSTTVLSGFDNLETVGGALRFDSIYVNAVSGFNSLISTGELDLGSLFEVETLDAFASLETVHGDLRFDRCHALSNLGTFGSLTSVTGDLTINDNDMLTDLSAWFTVTNVGGELVVTNNAALPTCEAEALRDAIGEENIGLSVTIDLNEGAGTCL